MRILAAIVTHNRCVLLRRCLDYLEAQVRLPDDILVVNNASSDDTVAMLEDRGIACVTQDNLGSAGGWHRCIEAALAGNFDAVWLMDDDGFAAPDALDTLEKLLKPDTVCVSSVVVKEDDREAFVFPFPILDRDGLPVLFRYPRKLAYVADLVPHLSGGMYPFVHLFNGALIRLDAVREIGNINQDFFMFGDEVDYFFRLRSVGHVISTVNARHMHPDVTRRPYTAIKVYYYVKNSIILNQKYFNRPWLRHILVIIAVLVRTARRNGVRSMFSLLGGGQSFVFYRAIYRGLCGRIGKDFRV